MNQKQILETRRFLNEVRSSNRSGSHVNCFRYFPNNSDEHEDTKFKVFKLLRKLNHNVLVEPIFNNGSRCDILDISLGVIYEVIHSEKETEVKNKNYPSCFGIVIIKSNKSEKIEVLE